MSGDPAMLCSFARAFSGWVREVAAPLALGYMGQRLVRIETGEAFACRARYDKPGAVPSEHAKGNAVDIVAFVLADGRRIFAKQQDDPTAHDFVQALRMTACGYFTTVLGPGTDPANADPLPLRFWSTSCDAEQGCGSSVQLGTRDNATETSASAILTCRLERVTWCRLGA